MSGCGFSIGDYDCREGGYMYDAGSGEGWDPEDCSFICPQCRTKDYLEDAKDEAETTSHYTNNGSSGTGVTIWAASEARALKANRPAAIRALIEIGIVNAIEDADNEEGFAVVMCNTQPALSLFSDYEALLTEYTTYKAERLDAYQEIVNKVSALERHRDALQQLLNERDQQVDELGQQLAASQAHADEGWAVSAERGQINARLEAQLAARENRLAGVDLELLASLKEFVAASYPVCTSIDERGYTWSESYLDAALESASSAIAKAELNGAPK